MRFGRGIGHTRLSGARTDNGGCSNWVEMKYKAGIFTCTQDAAMHSVGRYRMAVHKLQATVLCFLD